MTKPFGGAKAAILIGDRLLITLRDDKADIPFPNLWDLPGGGREGNETPEETLLREVREEVGLDLSADTIIGARAFLSDDDQTGPNWFFVVRLPAGAESLIVFGDEGQGWDLVRPQDFVARADAVPSLQARVAVWLANEADFLLSRLGGVIS